MAKLTYHRLMRWTNVDYAHFNVTAEAGAEDKGLIDTWFDNGNIKIF